MVRQQAPISVLVVSAHAGLQDILARILQRHDDMDFRGGVQSPQQALGMLTGLSCGVIISNLVPTSATDVMAWRRLADEGARALMLTSYFRDRALRLSILAGAAGYLLVGSARGDALAAAIRRVGMGESLVGPGATKDRGVLVKADSSDGLDVQEDRLLALILERRTNLQIAEETGLRIEQVHSVIRGLLDKLC